MNEESAALLEALLDPQLVPPSDLVAGLAQLGVDGGPEVEVAAPPAPVSEKTKTGDRPAVEPDAVGKADAHVQASAREVATTAAAAAAAAATAAGTLMHTVAVSEARGQQLTAALRAFIVKLVPQPTAEEVRSTTWSRQ